MYFCMVEVHRCTCTCIPYRQNAQSASCVAFIRHRIASAGPQPDRNAMKRQAGRRFRVCSSAFRKSKEEVSHQGTIARSVKPKHHSPMSLSRGRTRPSETTAPSIADTRARYKKNLRARTDAQKTSPDKGPYGSRIQYRPRVWYL